MWTRKELKDKAKVALKMNYWKAVLLVFIVMLIGDVFAVGCVTGELYSVLDIDTNKISMQQSIIEKVDVFSDELEGAAINIGSELSGMLMMVLILAGLGIGVAMIVGTIFSLAYSIFLVNPFGVGTRKFFCNSLETKGNLKDTLSAFKSRYMNSVKILLIMDIKIILWSLLFVIPGIIKMYEYMMIPYILSDNPDISTDDAFSESKRLMDGEKMDTFVLGLSFIGWNLLSSLTCGLLSIFFVAPYQCYTYAALYHKLSGKEEPFAGKDYDAIFENNSGEALFDDME